MNQKTIRKPHQATDRGVELLLELFPEMAPRDCLQIIHELRAEIPEEPVRISPAPDRYPS